MPQPDGDQASARTVSTRHTVIDYRKRVFRAMNYISRNIERDLSLEEIARTASFSMFHFHRIFKAVAGETVDGFTRRLRLELAANRLVSKKRADITTIAFECGFSSSQNFAKAFSRHFGTTPSEFRNSRLKAGVAGTDARNSLSGAGTMVLNRGNGRKARAADAGVKELPAFRVASVRRVGPYTGETCGPAFVELITWAVKHAYVGPGKVFAVYWDNPDVTPPERCRFDTCIIVPEGAVPEGQIFLQTIAGGPYAVYRFECTPGDIGQAWEDAFERLIDGGRECRDTPCYEVYHNNASEHPEGKWIFDICIPLK